MASISNPPPFLNSLYRHPCHHHFSPVTLSFPFRAATATATTTSFSASVGALKTGSESGAGRIGSPELLKKPVVSPRKDLAGITAEEREIERKRDNYGGDDDEREDDDKWVDWEDKILEDTVPLVGFVRMILHSEKYASGERLSPEHEKTVIDRLLPFHPEFEKKIGCGIDYITVGYHPDFERSRCLFVVQKDGKLVDFSYWKCIKGLIRKNYPLYADSFILRHFRQRRKRSL